MSSAVVDSWRRRCNRTSPGDINWRRVCAPCYHILHISTARGI